VADGMSGAGAGAAVELRPLRPEDVPAVNAAWSAVFGRERSLGEWRWKFGAGVPPAMLAWRGGELLAHYCGLPTRLRVDGRLWRAAQIVDVFTTPAARRGLGRRSVYVRTVEAFFREMAGPGRLELLYGFPGARALRLGVLQLGYDAMEPQPVPVWTRETPRGRRPRSFLCRAEEIAPDDPRLDGLWRRARHRYPVARVRDRAAIAHRLADAPRWRYRRFLLLPRAGREPCGFVAFRADGGSCRWVELVWDGLTPAPLELAAHLAARVAAEAGAERELLWLAGDAEAEAVLEGLGYRRGPHPEGLVVVARSFHPDLDVRRLEGRLYLTMADADLD